MEASWIFQKRYRVVSQFQKAMLRRKCKVIYSDVQDMLDVQKNISYEYVKFHGILSDEMMVYMEKEDGSPYIVLL